MALSPFRQVLLKVHSRCNLACDYCYVYRHADQSWRRRPRMMPPAVVEAVARRIAEHAAAWSLPEVEVVLHGGEPLLGGTESLDFIVGTVRRATAGVTDVSFSVQTNGLLLDEPMLDLLDRYGISVGVSLDGGRDATDRHRRFADGRGSYGLVADALERLRGPRYQHLFSGLLCTVDVRNDPVAVYEDLLSFQPPRIDLLLPHGNWTTRPPLRPDNGETPYGDWLVRIFDRWYDTPHGAAMTDIRLFSALLSLLLGGRSGVESLGLDPVEFVTVEADGAIEQGDALKTAAEGLAGTGLNVFDHPFDAALDHPGVRARQEGLTALADECRRCPLVQVCGGGLYAHRYRDGAGFRHPTVFCPDQQRLINHVRGRVEADLLAARRPLVTDSAGRCRS
ncbi:FxsB family radical SAM/SPASM domain protein [Actinoplanes sp. NBC_00393]|uniref:FxsB family cyclophane-forming radical SAM/SPASM peptide maturase n=1 Tax=Actinoplanes sp. NBC_00393 TaxID=2975953 RepID=UPI002E1A28C9